MNNKTIKKVRNSVKLLVVNCFLIIVFILFFILDLVIIFYDYIISDESLIEIYRKKIEKYKDFIEFMM